MATTSRLSALRSALQTAFEAEAALSGVTVSRFRPPADDLKGTEHIWLQNAAGAQTPASSSLRFDQIRLEIIIQVRVAGGDETAAATAEDRALVLLGAIEGVLASDTTHSGVVLDASLTEYTVTHDTQDGTRLCVIEAIAVAETELENS